MGKLSISKQLKKYDFTQAKKEDQPVAKAIIDIFHELAKNVSSAGEIQQYIAKIDNFIEGHNINISFYMAWVIMNIIKLAKERLIKLEIKSMRINLDFAEIDNLITNIKQKLSNLGFENKAKLYELERIIHLQKAYVTKAQEEADPNSQDNTFITAILNGGQFDFQANNLTTLSARLEIIQNVIQTANEKLKKELSNLEIEILNIDCHIQMNKKEQEKIKHRYQNLSNPIITKLPESEAFLNDKRLLSHNIKFLFDAGVIKEIFNITDIPTEDAIHIIKVRTLVDREIKPANLACLKAIFLTENNRLTKEEETLLDQKQILLDRKKTLETTLNDTKTTLANENKIVDEKIDAIHANLMDFTQTVVHQCPRYSMLDRLRHFFTSCLVKLFKKKNIGELNAAETAGHIQKYTKTLEKNGLFKSSTALQAPAPQNLYDSYEDEKSETISEEILDFNGYPV